MKLLRIAGIMIFLLSAAAFSLYKIYEFRNIDTTGPVINYNNDNITASVKTTKEELLKDVTAFDKKDGDVTETVIVEKLSGFIGSGKRTITYTAYDSNYNVTKWDRVLEYTDYTPPRFVLSKPLIFRVGEQNEILNNISVTDCIDGDLTEKIRYEVPDEFIGTSEGSYMVKFIVTNSVGDMAYLPASVEFYYPDYENPDKVPEITLSEYLVYIKTSDYFNAKSYLKGVKLDKKQYTFQQDSSGTGTESTISPDLITVQSEVNLRVPGTYEVNYSMTTEEGYEGITKLLVVVEE